MNDISTAWDNIADVYDESFGNEGDYSHKYIIYPAVKKILGNIKDLEILELGSGTGTFARMLSEDRAKVTGIDFSKKMLEIAKKRNQFVEYYLCDLNETFPFSDKSYDVAISIMVLHSISDITNTLNESNRVLKDGGRLIIALPHMAYVNQFRSVHLKNKDNYLSQQKGVFKWKQFGRFCKLPTTFYARSLQFYFESIVKQGFLINGIIEPAIIEEAKSDLDEVHTLEIWKRLREKPSFIIFDCTKNNVTN